MTDQAARFIGSIPEHYDRFLGPLLFHDFGKNLAASLAAQDPGSVLELAAGTGIVTRCLRDALPLECRLTATDLNPPMLEIAKSKFRADENVCFEPADATALPYGDSMFDAVVCQFGVMFFPDKQRSYEEVLRVLAPGGRYVFNVWGPWRNNPFAQITHETVAGFFPDDPPGFYQVPFGYHDADVIEEALYRAGFSRVTIRPESLICDIPSATDFSSGLTFGNPLYEEVTSRGGDPEQVRAAVAQAIADKLGSSMSIQALVIDALKD